MPAVLLVALAALQPAEPPVLTGPQLVPWIEKLRSGDPAVRRGAAEWIARLPPETLEVLVAELAKPKQSTPDAFRRLILEVWGQVPNWKGADPMWIHKPEPPWVAPPKVPGQPRAKRPPPHDPEKVDWLATINELDLATPALTAALPQAEPPSPLPKKNDPPAPPPPPPPTLEELATARAELLGTVAILRALAAGKRMEAAEPIFRFAFELEGVFRDECGRALRSMESYAVPSLIRFMYEKGTKEKPTFKIRRYASYQLDRMDRARPAKAITAAPDDRVRSAIIHAYGEQRAPEAVEAILQQTDSPSQRVRKEARWAWLRYVTGPAPPPAPKRKRKLAGGKEEDKEKPDYLTYREVAQLALQKEIAAQTGNTPEPKRGVKDLTDELFAFYDQRRAAIWDQHFEEGRKKEAVSDWKGAVSIYGWILSQDPGYAKRAEMAHAYVEYAEQLRAARQIPQALGFFRQSAALAPDAPEAKRAEARVALLDAEQLLALGHSDVASYQRALALDPSLKEARAGLLRAQSMRSRRRWLEVAEGAGGIAALALLLWWLWRRVTPPRPAKQA